MKCSSTIIISILGGMALGCAAAKLMHSSKAKRAKEQIEEALQDEFAQFSDKIKERHKKLLALIDEAKCDCKNNPSAECCE
ncbi:MAG: hypothetical protein SNJ33_01695 [Rikenellaceae bacterium]